MSTEKKKFDLTEWMRKDLWPMDAACRLVCGGNPYKWDDAARAALQETDPAKQLLWVKLFGDADGARAKKLFHWYEFGESRGVDPAEFLAWAKSKGYDVAHLISALPAKDDAATTQKRQRQDALAVELDEILVSMTSRTPAKVMAKLREQIGKPNTCILYNMGDGIKWENDRGGVKILKITALGERIREWKKTCLSQG